MGCALFAWAKQQPVEIDAPDIRKPNAGGKEMTGRIKELRLRLQPLAAREAELHLESHRVCHFEPGPNNTPKYIVSDEKRFAAIGKELEDIQDERTKILEQKLPGSKHC